MTTTQTHSTKRTSFNLRQYKPSDADRVWDIHERTIRASPLEFVSNPSFERDLREIGDHYLETGGQFLIGCLNGEAIATGGIKPVDEQTVELQRLRVLPEYQQNGYGTELLHQLETFAKTEGFECIRLHTDDVLIVAQRMYESRGYERTHKEPHPTIDGEVIFYEKEI